VVARRLAAGNRRLNAVGSVEAGHPSSVRASFGDNTPACRARYQLAQRASGSARRRSPGSRATNRRNRGNAIFLIAIAFRNLSVIGIAWALLIPPSWLRSPASAARVRELATKAAEKGATWPPPLSALLDDVVGRIGHIG
jgi:hypothetical protein